MMAILTLRSGRHRRFSAQRVGARHAQAFERWLERQEARDTQHGPIAATLMALLFYCSPTARCVRWTHT